MQGPRIAFYAPMKSPQSRVPSGDRTVARLLMAALESGGCDVRQASEMRTWSRTSADDVLERHAANSAREVDRLLAEFERSDWQPDVWFTYHIYYKAPDWIGPVISRALGIPYVIAEATYAGKRDLDDWAPWQAVVRDAMMEADAVLCFTDRDREGVLKAGVAAAVATPFPPFLGPEHTATSSKVAPRGRDVRLISVAMMRPGSKRESYRFLAEALRHAGAGPWHLTVVGDGPAGDHVQSDFAALSPGRVTFVGARDAAFVGQALAQSDIFVWPGLGEAFGMVYLEAQAAGVPVVALDTAGVGAVVRDGVSGVLVSDADPAAFAIQLDRLISDTTLRQQLSVSAANYVAKHHAFPVGVQRLSEIVADVLNQETSR